MKVTVLTGNQPHHIALIEALAAAGHRLTAVQEATTVRPGETADLFAEGPAIAAYFERVRAAEAARFGRVRPLPEGVRSLVLRLGDLPRLEHDEIAPLLDADALVMLGGSFVTGWLAEALIARGAVAVHMGLAPWYRGNSSNFWALADGRPEFVGATVYRIDRRVEAGPILFHALPPAAPDPFAFGMAAVAAAIAGLVERLPGLGGLDAVPQDLALRRRDSRRADFTDAVVRDFLDRPLRAADIDAGLARRPKTGLVRPYS